MEIPEELKAWRVFLGELLVNQLPVERQMQFWQRVLQRWPNHETFLADAEPSRRRTFRSLHLEKNEDPLQQVAIQLKEVLYHPYMSSHEGSPVVNHLCSHTRTLRRSTSHLT